MTRPKIAPRVRPSLRKALRQAGVNPAAADAALRSSLPVILERCGGNPHRMWALAWEVDKWACTRPPHTDDGGAYNLATAIYDHATATDQTGLVDGTHDHNQGRRWRDLHPPTPAESNGVTLPRPPRAAPRCGCNTCRWEQHHPRKA